MSRDFQLAYACAHLTVEEHVALDADRVSLPTQQPVANAGTVRLLINDEVFVPQSGLFSSARLVGALSGPFDVLPGEDTLTVTTPAGSFTFSFGLPPATVRNPTPSRFTAEDVVQRLARAGFNVATPEAANGHLVFEDFTLVGPDSFVEVSGTAAAVLGFGVAGSFLPPITTGERALYGRQRRAQGAKLYPGWRLVAPPDTITVRYPQFVEPVRTNPVFKMTYAAAGARCLRCGGTLVENDIRFDAQGQALMIENENLLYQAALKILLTVRGSNPYYNWYGSEINSRIGSKAIPGVASILNEDVRRALNKLQSLQGEQAKYQTVSFKERLYAVQSVNVRQHDQDPTTFLIDVTVVNAASDPINLTIVFTVPSVVALMGSNGLMLGGN